MTDGSTNDATSPVSQSCQCLENIARAEKDGHMVALKLVDPAEWNILKAVQTNRTYENHV
jgi:hypothetical protein